MADPATVNVARPVDHAAGRLVAGAALVGAAVAVAAGVYGKVHDPASETTIKLFFTSTLHLKAWFTTIAFVLAILQVLGAMWIYGRLPVSSQAPEWVGPLHRIGGSLILVFSLPVAYHCLWSLGFNPDPSSTRRFVHSIVGCAFYGAFVTKVLVVRSRRMPGWALPAAGAVLFTSLVLVWLTSSLWFFRTIGVEL